MEGNREGGSSEGSSLWVSIYIDTQCGSKHLEKYEVSKVETEVPKREKEEHISSTSFDSCTFKNQVIHLQTLGCDAHCHQKANRLMVIILSIVKRVGEGAGVGILYKPEKEVG